MQLELTNLHKSFNGNEVLRGVDLSVSGGEVVAFLGSSGSGKTTLLRCLNFLEKADSGTLEFDGLRTDLARSHKKTARSIRKKTAFVFQNFNLFRNLTALENITIGLTAGRGIPKAEAEITAKKMLEKVGLPDKAAAYPDELSGGQQQRVAIARALAPDPEIIYFDEPTSALDPELTGEVLGVIRSLAAEGRTMLIVSHEVGFVRNVSSRVVFMGDGRILQDAPTEEFFTHPANQRIADFLRMTVNK